MAIGIKKLIRMAEQIATNISISSDPDIVAGETTTHLKKFWDPRMVAELITDAEASGIDLSPNVAAAIAQLKKEMDSKESER